MPLVNLELYDGPDLLATFDLGTVAAAGTGSAVQVDLWNAKGDPTADVAQDVTLRVLARLPGETDWRSDLRAISEGWIEARVVAALGDAEAMASNWERLVIGGPLRLGALPPDGGLSLELRLSPLETNATQELEVLVIPEAGSVSVSLPAGVSQLPGVVSRYGDGSAAYVMSGGGLSASAVPDSFVQVADVVWIAAGAPRVLLAHEVEIDANAADGPLAVGTGYWAALTLTDGPAVVVTKSNAAAHPAPLDARPAVPAGHLLLGWVYREEGAVIEGADVFSEVQAGAFAFGAAGLNGTIGGGVAHLPRSVVTWSTQRVLALPPGAATGKLWLLPAGQPDITTDGSRPDPEALHLWDFATDGAGVTAQEDRRTWVRRRLQALRFEFPGVLAVAQESYAALDNPAPAWLVFPVPLLAQVGSNGAGNASGATVWELELWDGATWASLFPSSGSDDRRPAIAYDAADLQDRGALPEVVELPPWARFRARVVEIPAGGTAPQHGEVVLFAELS